MFTILIILLVVAICYLVLWFLSMKEYPVKYGISFNQNYAESLDLDWKKVYEEILTDLQPKYIRIAAMWSEVEKNKGEYDFADVDWMMDLAKENNTKVTLVVGQKAPRWPECYVPEWAGDLEGDEYKTKLLAYVSRVVERYKKHSALEIWQVENEPFIKFRFGECENFKKDLVDDEIESVRLLDKNHKIMVTDSGELSSWRRAAKAGDIFGTTIYRIVGTPYGLNFTYDWLPPAYYRLKAKLWGREVSRVYVSELQAEPWFTNGGALNTSLEIQEKTMNPDRLIKHFKCAESIGVKRAYLWGVEWWYWMKDTQNKSFYWDFVKTKLNS